MKKLLVIFLLLNSLTIAAQNATAYNPGKVQLKIPSFLPGVMKDPVAVLRNDSLIYSFKGELFKGKGYAVSKNSGNTQLATPLQTVIELTDAYAKKDKNRIVELYNESSKGQVRQFINSADADEFLSDVNKAVAPPVYILASLEYMNGYIVFIKDNMLRVHMNYVVNEGGKYKLSILKDKKPTSWNVNVYFNTGPKPMIPLRDVAVRDSLQINDSILLKISLPQNDLWVAVFTGDPNESIQLMAQDNGLNDLDPARNEVSLYLPGYIFMKPGSHYFFISAFNYPVQRISKNFYKREGLYKIKIYE